MSSQSETLNHPSHRHDLYLTNIHNSVLRHDCNACRQQIRGFSYRCGRCNFDLHITCASMPLSLIHKQSYQSTPTANLSYQAAGGTLQFPTGPTPRPWPPLIYNNYQAGPPTNHVNHGHGRVRPSGRGSGRGNNSVMNQAIPGLIIGTTQSLAMYGVHTLLGVGAFPGTTNIWGGGSNAYGGNDGGGGDWGGDGGPFNYYDGNGGGDSDWGGDGGPSSDGGSF